MSVWSVSDTRHALDWQRSAGDPRGARVGNPPTSSAAARSSISRESSGTPSPTREHIMDESMRAAYCRLNHGDPYQSEEVRAAHQGRGDLIARTWRKEREMTRDERRLMARYQKTLAADEAASLAAYRQCPKCSGSPNGEPS